MDDNDQMKECNEPVVSACIANYNRQSLLADCIDSILAQDCGFAVEILVHDDASTDASLPLLLERYPQIEVIASTTNVGFCIANNRLADRARGEFILLLNNDAALTPNALTTLLAHARRQQPAGILTLPQYDWETNELVDRGCLLDPFYNPVPNLDPFRRDVAMVIGACLWIPRGLWHELGGFPDWFESIAEDMYLCCRARLAGYPVEVTTSSAYRHRQGKSFGGNRANAGRLTTTYRRRRLSERNKTYVLAVCTPAPWVWLLLPLQLLTLLAEGTLLALIRREYRLLREIYASVPLALVRHRSRLRQERKRAQKTRNTSTAAYARGFLGLPHKLRLLQRYGLPEVR